jgi:hypothetical protein
MSELVKAFGGALRGRDAFAQPKRVAEGFDELRSGARPSITNPQRASPFAARAATLRDFSRWWKARPKR